MANARASIDTVSECTIKNGNALNAPDPVVALFQALLTYLLAFRQPIASDGGSVARQPDVVLAAGNLLDAVRSLPQFHVTGRERATALARDEEASRLLADLANLEHSHGANHLFRVHAEEIAARARLLQEECPSAKAQCSYLIRRLTALASRRGIHVFGLSRAHRADWSARASAARANREGLVATRETETPRTLHREEIPSSQETPRAEPQDELDVPLVELRKMARSHAVVVVGGAARSQIRDQIARRANLDIEWIETRGGGTRLVESVVKRVQDAGIAALVLVEGAMLHRHTQPLIAAARRSSTPLEYAKKGGVTQVLRALLEIERGLVAQGAAEPAA